MPDPAHGHAFGLGVRAPFAIPGLAPGGDGLPAVAVETGAAAEVEALVPAAERERISDHRPLSIDTAPERGYLFTTEFYGTHWVSAAGDRILCAPPADAEDWFWQRILIGQLLPFATLLHGREVFHAGAVVRDGAAVALVAASGVGKTTVATELVLAGDGFLADDVVALEPTGDGLLAHPGAGLVNLRPSAEGVVDRAAAAGRIEGQDDTSVRVAIDVHPEPVPLGTVCFLTRAPAGTGLNVVRPEPVDPRMLLASTFNFVLMSAERQERLLDVCARAARGIVLQAELAPETTSAATATAIGEAVDRHARR